MNAVIYARVSSKKQEQGYSIEAQLDLLREYGSHNEIEILSGFIEVETAKKAGRAKFRDMLEFLKVNPECKIILVEKTDRLYRNWPDMIAVDDLNIEIHFVKEGEVLGPDSHASKQLIHEIKVALARNYIRNLGEEVKKGLKRKREKGEWSHKAPYGYRNNPDSKSIEPVPDQALNVRFLYEGYASGNHSLESLRRAFKAKGLIYNRSHQVMSKGQLEHILKNPIYCGLMRINGEIFTGIHEPIISKALFDKVQSLWRAANKPKLTKLFFKYAGLITCERCGCAITAEIQKGRYIYYHCTGNRKTCDKVYVCEEKLDEQVDLIVEGLQVDPEFHDAIISTLKSSHKDEVNFHKQAVSRLRERETGPAQEPHSECV